VRELRNDGGSVLDRVARGERLVVTRDGTRVAELRPLPRTTPRSADLVERRRRLPDADPEAWRRDVDAVLDATL
jgi:antitoxin (DNA-binding transcriptional repressor) of toxin-antitoxin stability system